MEEAAALKKTLAQSSKGKEKAGFYGGYPRKSTSGRGGGGQNVYGPGLAKKWKPATGSRPRRKWLELPLVHVKNLIKCVSVTPSLSPIGTPAHYIKVLMGTLDMTIQAPCWAGGLAHYVRNWEVITQDRWVLQAIVGYKLDLIQTPYQGSRPAVLRHNQIDQTLITEEVQELLAKQAIRESQLSPNSFISELFLVEKREWAKASGQSEGSKQFCALRALQDGRPPLSPGPDSDRGLYDQARSERCISPDPNPSGSPTSPISVDGENISILMPSFRADLSSKGIHKGAKATNWNTPADGDSICGLPGWYPYPSSGQGGARESSPIDLQPFQSTRISDQHQEILTNSPTEHRIPRSSDKISDSANSDATGEAEENPANARGLLQHQSVTVQDLARLVRKTTALCKEIWQSSLHYRGIQALMNSVSPEAEDNPALTGRFNIRLPLSEEARQDLLWWVSLRTVPLQAPLLPRVPSMIITSDASTTGWGVCLGDTTTGGTWSAQEMMHHINYLSSSCLPGSTMFSEDRKQYNHSSKIGQRDSSHLHQPVGRNSL